MKQLVVAAVLLLLAAGVPAAQQDPPEPAPQAPPRFRSGVQLIEVDARVFDKDGTFIADLTKEDFDVLEDGVPQRIDAMYLVTGPPRAAAPDKAGPPEPAGPVRPSPVAAQTWIFF